MQNHKYLGIIIFIFTSLIVLPVRAEVIVNDAAIISAPYGSNQWLTLTKSFNEGGGQGLFAIEIAMLSPSTFNFSYAGIAEEYALFEVSNGEIFDKGFIYSHTPIVSNYHAPWSSVQSFSLGQSKYYGYWDEGFGSRMESYGWVDVTRVTSGLVASASATALGSGIVVGSVTQVPEPTSAELFLLGGLITICWVRWNKSKKLDSVLNTSLFDGTYA